MAPETTSEIITLAKKYISHGCWDSINYDLQSPPLFSFLCPFVMTFCFTATILLHCGVWTVIVFPWALRDWKLYILITLYAELNISDRYRNSSVSRFASELCSTSACALQMDMFYFFAGHRRPKRLIQFHWLSGCGMSAIRRRLLLSFSDEQNWNTLVSESSGFVCKQGKEIDPIENSIQCELWNLQHPSTLSGFSFFHAKTLCFVASLSIRLPIKWLFSFSFKPYIAFVILALSVAVISRSIAAGRYVPEVFSLRLSCNYCI